MPNSNKKYDAIVTAARALFWKHGFRRVSIEEICREANVSKMTYYKHFPNKIELAKTIFNDVIEEGETRFRQTMKEDIPGTEKIKNLIKLKIEGTNDISQEFLQDFYSDSVPELHSFVAERIHKTWDIMIEDFKVAQQAGMIRKDFKLELLVKVQNKLIEMMDDEDLLKLYGSQQDLILEFTNLIIYGIVPHD